MDGLKRCPYCAETVQAAAIKCKHCGSALEAKAPDVVPVQTAVAQPVRNNEKGPASRIAIGVGVLVVLCLVAVGLAERSPPIGYLLVVAGLLLVGCIVVGRHVDAAPGFLERGSQLALRHRWWTFGAIAMVLCGSMAGIDAQKKKARPCHSDYKHAFALKADGAPAADLIEPLNRAIKSCGKARLGEKRKAAQAAKRDAVAEAKRNTAAREETKRKSSFEAAVGKARESAKDEAQADTTIAAYLEAQQFGELEPSDRTELGNLLVSRAAQLAKKKNFIAALSDLENASELAIDLEGFDSQVAVAKKGARNQRVQEWIDEAMAVAKDKKKCDTPKAIDDAWTNLKNTTKEDRLYRKAVAATKKLERCRKKVSRELVKAGQQLMKSQREGWASRYETALLDEGMDVRVHLGGKWKTRVKIVYILFSRVWSHQITDGGSMKPGSFLASLQDMGFTRVTFSDGYSESFYYDLDPVDEKKAFGKTLEPMGLGSPLKL